MVRAMLSESLQAVISQTLCKTKDGTAASRRTRSCSARRPSAT